MNKNFLTLSLIAFFVATFFSCLQNKSASNIAEIDFGKIPFKKLSEYKLYKGKLAEMMPNEGLLEYEPVSSLFTDYASKKRFVWMPKGSSASFNYAQPNEALDFPEKTILVKNFYYQKDLTKEKTSTNLIETRLLIKKDGNWEAYSYKWNKEQSDAEYKITGGIIPVEWINENGEKKSIKYAMPNKNQCKSCHTYNNKMMPIGPKLKQLNHAINFEGEMMNQLEKWNKVGFIKTVPESNKIINLVNIEDENASLDQKARSYLDVNCGHCHSTTGPASTSGLRLNYEENNPYHWGVGKSPVAAGMGAGSFKYDIKAGNSQESIFIYRMNSTHPGVMMPELGRVSIHKEGVDLISKWIDGLPD